MKQEAEPTRAKKATDNPVPLIEDVMDAMQKAGFDTLQPHVVAMRPSELSSTFILAAMSVAWRIHMAYMTKIGISKTRARLLFLNAAKTVAKGDPIPEPKTEEG